MEFFRKIKTAVLIALIPAMLALTGNAIFNLHIHKQTNGCSFMHAHPTQDNGAQKGTSHSHTCNDCVSIQQITGFIYIAITALFLGLLFAKQLRQIQVESLQVKFGYTASPLYNRPPPFLA
ncbi:hypothetical protein L3073_08450 [Ancylomarina sp. DW003]|nr:hypothetical protein [Ancylomarina sp. DW003]MDE5422237.1 hypothetical protein [Ancylomarina sp. DW003]